MMKFWTAILSNALQQITSLCVDPPPIRLAFCIMKVLSGMVSTIIVEDDAMEDVPEELTNIRQDIVLVVSC